MTANVAPERQNKLILAVGLGPRYEIPLEVARHYAGMTIHGALARLSEEHIQDPALRSMLSERRLAFELFRHDGREIAVTQNSPWDELLREVGEGDTELAIARFHYGPAQRG